jgi:hypothetical protein
MPNTGVKLDSSTTVPKKMGLSICEKRLPVILIPNALPLDPIGERLRTAVRDNGCASPIPNPIKTDSNQ